MIFVLKVYLQEQIIMANTDTSPTGQLVTFDPFYIAIPPYSSVRVTADNEGSSATLQAVISLTGRIYRG